jgi:sarcosine oxidase
VTFVSACSGHGFKHSAALGEALAAQALGRVPPVSLDAFSAPR